MAKDYARHQAPKRGNKPRRKPSAQAKKPKPVWLFLLATLGVGCFGYFLWSIKDKADDSGQQTLSVKEASPRPITASHNPNNLPPKPKEEWGYVKELENKQVEVDIPVTEPRSIQWYQLQCGSFRTESQANRMKANIAFQGLQAEVKQSQGTTGLWYRVTLGPYDSKREGESKRHVLQRAGMNGCQIWLADN